MKRVTHKKGLRLIAGYKIVKGLLFLGASGGLLALLNPGFAALVKQGANALHADLYGYVVHQLIATFGVVDVQMIEELGAGTLAYGSLTLTEGIGLWLALRWAAYLTIATNSLFIPVELYKLSQGFTLMTSVVLVINVAIVWYLVEHLKAERKHVGHLMSRHGVDT